MCILVVIIVHDFLNQRDASTVHPVWLWMLYQSKQKVIDIVDILDMEITRYLRQTNNCWLVNCWSSQFQTADDRHIHGVIYLIILSLVEWELNHSLSLLVWALNRRDHRAVCRILCHYCNHLSYYIMMSTAPKYTVAFRGEAPHIMDILQIHCHGLK